MIIDDVITAGTAIREAIGMITGEGAEVAGVAIGLDRQERGQGERSAIQELEQDEKLRVVSIVKLADIVEYLERQSNDQNLVERIRAYRSQYGVA